MKKLTINKILFASHVSKNIFMYDLQMDIYESKWIDWINKGKPKGLSDWIPEKQGHRWQIQGPYNQKSRKI